MPAKISESEKIRCMFFHSYIYYEQDAGQRGSFTNKICKHCLYCIQDLEYANRELCSGIYNGKVSFDTILLSSYAMRDMFANLDSVDVARIKSRLQQAEKND